MFISKVLEPGLPLRVEPALCLRARYAANGCTACVSDCPAEAISLDLVLTVSERSCTGCLLCAGVCPTEALALKDPVRSNLMGDSDGKQDPVIACREFPELKSDIRTACLGWLSESDLAVLLAKTNGFKLNVSRCKRCEKGPLVLALGERAASVMNKLGSSFKARIRLVEDNETLTVGPKSFSRRQFFMGVLDSSARQLDGLNWNSNEPARVNAGSKPLPEKMEILNRAAVKALPGFFADFYYGMIVDEQCNGCLECVAICPTDALLSGGDSEQQLLFDPTRCIGCNLCVEFCSEGAIQIEAGNSDSSVVSLREFSGEYVTGQQHYGNQG